MYTEKRDWTKRRSIWKQKPTLIECVWKAVTAYEFRANKTSNNKWEEKKEHIAKTNFFDSTQSQITKYNNNKNIYRNDDKVDVQRPAKQKWFNVWTSKKGT